MVLVGLSFFCVMYSSGCSVAGDLVREERGENDGMDNGFVLS